jgi:hypothetical protein
VSQQLVPHVLTHARGGNAVSHYTVLLARRVLKSDFTNRDGNTILQPLASAKELKMARVLSMRA